MSSVGLLRMHTLTQVAHVIAQTHGHPYVHALLTKRRLSGAAVVEMQMIPVVVHCSYCYPKTLLSNQS